MYLQTSVKHKVRVGGKSSVVVEFGIAMKLETLIKMCLNETHSRIRVGKHLSDMFPIKNGLKQGDALPPLLFNFALEYANYEG